MADTRQVLTVTKIEANSGIATVRAESVTQQVEWTCLLEEAPRLGEKFTLTITEAEKPDMEEPGDAYANGTEFPAGTRPMQKKEQ